MEASFKNFENISSCHVEVENNPMSRKTCLKFGTQKCNENFYFLASIK